MASQGNLESFCVICFAGFGDSQFGFTDCHQYHRFCKNCIGELLLDYSHCPVDRKEISTVLMFDQHGGQGMTLEFDYLCEEFLFEKVRNIIKVHKETIRKSKKICLHNISVLKKLYLKQSKMADHLLCQCKKFKVDLKSREELQTITEPVKKDLDIFMEAKCKEMCLDLLTISKAMDYFTKLIGNTKFLKSAKASKLNCVLNCLNEIFSIIFYFDWNDINMFKINFLDDLYHLNLYQASKMIKMKLSNINNVLLEKVDDMKELKSFYKKVKAFSKSHKIKNCK